jgi:hypothetical protein
MGRFWDFLKDAKPPPGELPLIHNTDLFFFRQIRLSEKLKPSDCDVYKGEKLLYFFYGRPSYCAHVNLGTVTARALLPICLVLSRSVIAQATRIVAFDSGAFARQYMHPPMHEKWQKRTSNLQSPLMRLRSSSICSMEMKIDTFVLNLNHPLQVTTNLRT